MSFSKTATLLAATLLVCAGNARADLDFYTSQASFTAAVSNAGTDTFSDLSASVLSPLTRAAGSHAYTMSTSYSVDEFGHDTYDYIHPRASASDGNVYATANQAFQSIAFGGFSNIAGFGGNFFLTSFGAPTDNPPFLAIYVVTSANQYYGAFDTTQSTDGSFFGIVTTGQEQILSVSVTAFANNADGTGGLTSVDNLTLAQAVPEPESYALMLGGLGLLGLLASRRSRRPR